MTVPKNIPINQTSDLPNILEVRLSLLGSTIARDLSRILILILIILTPVTFSNDNIPNFRPDGVSSYSQSAKTCCTVAVIQPETPAPAIVDEESATTHLSPDSGPHTSHTRSSQQSRAPPA